MHVGRDEQVTELDQSLIRYQWRSDDSRGKSVPNVFTQSESRKGNESLGNSSSTIERPLPEKCHGVFPIIRTEIPIFSSTIVRYGICSRLCPSVFHCREEVKTQITSHFTDPIDMPYTRQVTASIYVDLFLILMSGRHGLG
jgi:hypothetical protein